MWRKGFRNMNDGSYCTWTLMFGDLHGSTICSSNILHQAQGKVKMQGIGFPLVICQAEQGCPLLAGLPQKLQHGSWVIMQQCLAVLLGVPERQHLRGMIALDSVMGGWSKLGACSIEVTIYHSYLKLLVKSATVTGLRWRM